MGSTAGIIVPAARMELARNTMAADLADRHRGGILPWIQEQLQLRPFVGGSKDLGWHCERIAIVHRDGEELRQQ